MERAAFINGLFDSRQSQTITALPIEFEALSPIPQLLPGENPDGHRALQAAVFPEIAPKSAIEWLLAIDIAELSWEMHRYAQIIPAVRIIPDGSTC